jgi:hypothetical protein
MGADTFVADEASVWRYLKATAYYKSLHACWTYSRPLDANCWLRMAMQTPTALDMVELARIFDEEDTMTALTTVRLAQHQNIMHLCASRAAL